MPSRYTPRFRSVMKAGRIALLVGLSVLLSVRPVHAKNGKLTVAGRRRRGPANIQRFDWPSCTDKDCVTFFALSFVSGVNHVADCGRPSLTVT
jgi:hypothetical protein